MGRPGCRETRFVQANCMGGILAKNGMAGFSNSLSDADVEAIQQYLLKRQSDLYNQKKIKCRGRRRCSGKEIRRKFLFVMVSIHD